MKRYLCRSVKTSNPDSSKLAMGVHEYLHATGFDILKWFLLAQVKAFMSPATG